MRLLNILALPVLITGATATIALAQPAAQPVDPSQVPPSAASASNTMPPSPALRAARKQVRLMCDSDLAKACPDAHAGPRGGLGQCIKQHFRDFSADCQGALKSLRQVRQSQ